MWTVTFIVARQKGAGPRHYDRFKLEVDPDEYVLDGVERIWAYHDRSLTFRHACHHSTCGACGMLVNGVEKLTCITPIRSISHDGGTIKIEPLRNFPVDSDLVVDMSDFYLRMERARFSPVAPLPQSGLPYEKDWQDGDPQQERLVDCIECGICISACPVALTTPTYMGPAVLGAIHDTFQRAPDASLLSLADQQDGVWRCHSVYECSAACPSNVDPAWRIMNLRKRIMSSRIRNFFQRNRQERVS